MPYPPMGNAIVGWDADPRAYTHDSWCGGLWWQGMERLLHPFGWIGQAEATNDSGSVIVGRGHPSNTLHAYRFTAGDGTVVDLGALTRGILPGTQDQEDTSTAFAVSDDGNVVVGSSGFKPPLDAFIWTPDTKMVKLSTYLTDKGVTGVAGWRLVGAYALTPDGKTIAGLGIDPAGVVDGWVVKLK
jgi:hypothetical protein